MIIFPQLDPAETFAQQSQATEVSKNWGLANFISSPQQNVSGFAGGGGSGTSSGAGTSATSSASAAVFGSSSNNSSAQSTANSRASAIQRNPYAEPASIVGKLVRV